MPWKNLLYLFSAPVCSLDMFLLLLGTSHKQLAVALARVQQQQLLQRVSSTSCNLLKELAFAMLVRCGFRLKGMAN